MAPREIYCSLWPAFVALIMSVMMMGVAISCDEENDDDDVNDNDHDGDVDVIIDDEKKDLPWNYY